VHVLGWTRFGYYFCATRSFGQDGNFSTNALEFTTTADPSEMRLEILLVARPR